MNIVEWERAAPLILSDVPNVPDLLIEQKLLSAAREFFRFSLAWRVRIDPFVTAAGVHDYDVIDTRHTEVVKILDAWIGAVPLRPLDPSEMLRIEANATVDRGQSEAMSFDGAYLVLAPAPSAAGLKVRAEVAFMPSLSARGLPPEQWERHIETIADGAKARLLAAKGQAYSDAALAGIHETRYRDARTTAQRVAARAHTRARRGTPARFF